VSAYKLRQGIQDRYGVNVAIIINDSIGRAWRVGSMGLAIGVSGFTALEDYVGGADIFGRELVVTQVGAADEMAAGASLVMGQTDEKTPVVLVRGYQPEEPEDESLRGVQTLIRPKEQDLFR
jgi:coenzyme F420-0:L-glutamate ligase/coenzyme F420-1:gamma-L-glutamate ligase